MATSKFQYAPGVPGYGSKGADGSVGLLGNGMYFSSYDGKTDTNTIRNKIQTNKEFFPTDTILPGYPTRTYQTGDLFIDKNARIFQIDLTENNLFIDTLQVLNTSELFVYGFGQSVTPNFQRYSNAYQTDKKLIDVVYSNSIANWSNYPEYIYNTKPEYYASIMFVDNDILPNDASVYPFQIWKTELTTDNDSIALTREHGANIWHLGNSNNKSVRTVELSLDFSGIALNGELNSDIIPKNQSSDYYDIGSHTNPWGKIYGSSFISSPTSTSGEEETGLMARAFSGEGIKGAFGFHINSDVLEYHWIGKDSAKPLARFAYDGVDLYCHDVLKFQTVDAGAKITGDLEITEDLNITGGLNIDGAIDCSGSGEFASLNINNGDLTVDGNYLTELGGDLDVSGDTYINGRLEVDEPTELNQTLDVSGNATFNSDIIFDSKIYPDGAIGAGILYANTNITLSATTPSSANGGYVKLEAGDGNGTNTIGGDIQLKPGIGTSTDGEVTAVNFNMLAGNFILNSDIRLKENIEPIIKSEEIDETKIVQFNFKNDKSRLKYGVIAQELEKTHPEMVFDDREGFKRVNYTEFLLAKVDRLERRLSEIENKL